MKQMAPIELAIQRAAARQADRHIGKRRRRSPLICRRFHIGKRREDEVLSTRGLEAAAPRLRRGRGRGGQSGFRESVLLRRAGGRPQRQPPAKRFDGVGASGPNNPSRARVTMSTGLVGKVGQVYSRDPARRSRARVTMSTGLVEKGALTACAVRRLGGGVAAPWLSLTSPSSTHWPLTRLPRLPYWQPKTSTHTGRWSRRSGPS
jgi:hypothetical protein